MLHHLKSSNADIVIISDANTLFIETILRKNGCLEYVDRIITNPGWFDEDERLHIQRRIGLDDVPHGCERPCAPNLCKGSELLKYIEEMGCDYDQIIYSGDGRNDFCPSTKLSQNDYLLMRKGHALEKIVYVDGVLNEMLLCQVMPWDTQDDLLGLMKRLV